MPFDKALYTAEMISTAGRDGSSNRPDGSFPLKLTVPAALGGPGGDGTNPEELFAAGDSACFIGALKVAGRQARQPVPDDVQVAARVSLGKVDTGYGLAVELVVHLPGLPREVALALVEKAHQTCPYSNATRGNIDVALTLA